MAAGAGAQQAVGVVVIGGMVAATTLGLFIIPSLFVVIQGITERFGGKQQPRSE